MQWFLIRSNQKELLIVKEASRSSKVLGNMLVVNGLLKTHKTLRLTIL